MTLRILNIIPRMIGGGPERGLLALASEMSAIGDAPQRTVAVLDSPVSPKIFLAARRLRIKVVIRPDDENLRHLISRSDIVQIHYWNHPKLLALLCRMEFPKARVIVQAHVLGLTAPHVLTDAIGCFGDALILTSEASERSAGAQAAKAKGKLVVSHLSVADMSRLERFERQPHDGCVVGYLGVINGTKMHPHFAKMAARVRSPAVKFLICGGGGGELALQCELDSLGLGEVSEILGPVEDIRSVLARMDIFGYPLSEQTSATSEKALQEAMWVGLPPVVFPHGGIRCLVENDVTGLIARTEAEYVTAIERLAGDANLRARLGAEAQRFARKHFNPRRWAAMTIDLLQEVSSWPLRHRTPLGGNEGAAGFVAALGNLGGPFAISLAGDARELSSLEQIEASDKAIAASHGALAHGEGGIIHYRNTFPGDPHLRLWSGLLAEEVGNFELARAEYETAGALGMIDSRLVKYLSRCAKT
jgi:glycosyltransferase involved in cell wall biosynthesis